MVGVATRLAVLACALALPVIDAAAQETPETRIERGRYLVTAADCAACHTAPGGKPFAGSRAIATPFGTIYSPNITPDRETGIGKLDEDAFYRALHAGRAHDGTHLYPAFPYPYFTKITRDDAAAMYAHLRTLEPVKSERRTPELDWPLGWRFLMTGWNLLFFREGTFRGDPRKDRTWNRGAYLVQALGHCGACHTAKNVLGADRTGHALEGGLVDDWFAPDITGDAQTGIGTWSAQDLVEYLKTGHNARSDAVGPMAEVIASSTSKLTDPDLLAIATYLRAQKGHPSKAPPAPEPETMAAGKKVYDICAACHEDDGSGSPRVYTALANNANMRSLDPTTLIRLTLEGATSLPSETQPTPGTMPGYRNKLSDRQIADVLSYVRNSFGNSAPAVSAREVKALREKLAPH
jgi:mono/diheme cytochrome c family protein